MNLKRITSVLLSLVMLLSLSIASAQEAAPLSRTTQVMKGGKSIESTMTLKVSPDTLRLLMANSQGADSQEGKDQLNTLIGALNKLVFKSLSGMTGENKQSANITIGTDKASLIDMNADVDMTTGENAITASVLPGIVMKMDQAQMAASVQQGLQLQEHPEQLQMLDEKYQQVIADAFAKEILPGLKAEEGEFTEQGVLFDSRIEGDITPVPAARFVKAVIAVAKDDAELKSLLDSAIKGSPESANKLVEVNGKTEPLPFKNADEALMKIDEQMDKVIAEGSSDKVMHLVAYRSKASNQTLVCIKTFSSDGSEYKISALVTPSDKGSSLDAFLLFNPIADTDPEAADWTKLKENIKAGTSVAATQVALTLDTQKDDTKSNFTLHINMADVGMPFELSVMRDETLAGAYESNTKVTFSMLLSDPLAEVVIHSTESDKKAEPVSIPDGTQIVEIKENISDEDMAPIIQVLQEKGLPMLMENLSKALPDEYGLIMQMLSSSFQQEGSVKAN